MTNNKQSSVEWFANESCQLKVQLDTIICSSYAMHIHNIIVDNEEINIIQIFYRHMYTSFPVNRSFKKRKTVTTNELNFIRDYLFLFNTFIVYLLKDFEKDFNTKLGYELYKTCSKILLKINKLLEIIPNFFIIDDYPIL